MTATTKHRATIETVVGPTQRADILRGRITLDQGKTPHVEAEVTIKRPNDTMYAALDPRTSPQVLISGYADDEQVRVFLLAVRSREYTDGELVIRAASFESILTDYAPLVDDYTPLSLASSLRTIVTYVLQKSMPEELWVIGGLWPTPAIDADMTRYWSVTNLHPNPLPASVTGYNIASTGTALTYTTLSGEGVIRWTSTANVSNLNAGTINAYRATPGRKYYAAWDWASSAAGRSAALVMEFRTSNGLVLMSRTTAPFTPYSATFQTLTVEAVAPPGTETVYVYITTTGNTVATQHYVKRFILTESDYPVSFFYGGSASDANYAYAWTEGANASPSTRTAYVERPPAALVWRAGVSALDFLLPLVQSSGYRLVNNGRWTLRDETYRASGSTTIAAGANIVTSTDSIDREARLWFDAQVTRYTWTDVDGMQYEAVDAYALDPDDYRLVNLEEKEQPYPGPGYSEYSVRRAQERGHEVVATTMTSWDTTAEQPITITLDDGIEQQGVIQSVEFDLELDEMTVTVRPDGGTP